MADKDADRLESGPDTHSKHLGGLLKGLMGDLSSLIRLEIALAKAEMKEKALSVAVASALLGAAAFFGFLAVGVMTATIIIAISLALPTWLAALIVMGAYLLLAIVLAAVGVRRLSKRAKQAPEQKNETAEEGVSWAKRRRGSRTTSREREST